MGEVIHLRFGGSSAVDAGTGAAEAPRTVHQDRGWRILRVPRLGRYVALSARCRAGITVGRFDPRDESESGDSDVALLTDCAFDEDLGRCAVTWLNGDGPERAILGSFIVATRDRYLYWKDAILEVAAIGGLRLVRLVDGCVAAARDPAPVILLNPFARTPSARRTREFDRLPPDTRRAVLHWTDPRRQLFGPPDREPELH
jgi:hypothetical protein